MNCPICSSKLKTDICNLVKCGGKHRFYVEWAENLSRKLVLAVACGEHKAKDEWPIDDEEAFDQN